LQIVLITQTIPILNGSDIKFLILAHLLRETDLALRSYTNAGVMAYSFTICTVLVARITKKGELESIETQSPMSIKYLHGAHLRRIYDPKIPAILP
jgi:hypothetical protein